MEDTNTIEAPSKVTTVYGLKTAYCKFVAPYSKFAKFAKVIVLVKRREALVND